MLTELRISHFALIEELTLQFSPGFNVLTGESGAGKSILVDAISLLVGGRASADQIRADADEAVLEAAFSLPSRGETARSLRDAGLLAAGEVQLIVRRVLSRTGRNRVYLNGSLASLQQLQALGGTLVDIHGQHEQQSLLANQTQLDALDAFGHLSDLRLRYAEQYHQWQQHQHRLEQASVVAMERERQHDLLVHQCRELEEAELRIGEEECLAAERQRLLHGRRLAELAEETYSVLYGNDVSVLSQLGVVSARLRELRKIDSSTEEWCAMSDGAGAALRDVAERLRSYRDTLEQDPDRLTVVDERWDRLQRLKKKYGLDVDGLLSFTAQLRHQLDGIGEAGTQLAQLRTAVAEDQHRVMQLGGELSEYRQRAARKMESRIKAELRALKMDQTEFHIHVIRHADETGYGPCGCDTVEYAFSANAGEPLQPLAKTASGGELSRVMLATKTVLADTDRVPVLIFDEVDTGIGGAVATVMARRLRDLGTFHQVFCITHLPQIASQAEHHYIVQKAVVGKRTVVRVTALDAAARHEEIARMLAGHAITRSVRETAAEMISNAGDPS